MNRTYLLVLLLGASLFAPAQTVVPPYNPDADQDSAIGAGDLLGLLPLFGTYFTPAEVMVDGQTLTEYIDALEEAASNATSDTVAIPMVPGTAPGQMLYWDGTEWTLVPTGQSGDALLLDGTVPEWRRLKTGCPDSLYLEYDPMATVDDGSCITLVVSGCTSPQYNEFEEEANVDDGSCETLVYHDSVSCNEFEAPPGAVQSSSDNPCQVDWTSANGDTIWHVIDNQGPVWDSPTLFVYEESGGNCEEMFTFDMANNPAVLPLMATDNCSDSCSYQVISTLISGGCLASWQREWTAYDFCGNESEVLTQLVQLVDDEEPAVFAPQDTTLFMQYDCGVEITPDLTGLAVVTDNCTNAGLFPEYFEGQADLEGYLTFTDVVTPDPCSFLDSVSSYTITRTWETFDYCYNIGTDVQVITIETGVSCESPTMDGHTYDVVEIGDQCWFAENLRTTVYRNGDVIPAGLTDGEWSSTTSGATAVYGEDDGCNNYSPDIDACDDVQSLAEYGRLYNWKAVDDARSLCPSGWHVPTDGEWTDLENHISSQGFSGTEGTALKSAYGWYNGGNGTDDFGFSALPGGNRSYYNGYFYNAANSGYWWSSSPSGGSAWGRNLYYNNPDVYRDNPNPRYGFSVRCLRDAD